MLSRPRETFSFSPFRQLGVDGEGRCEYIQIMETTNNTPTADHLTDDEWADAISSPGGWTWNADEAAKAEAAELEGEAVWAAMQTPGGWVAS